MNSGFSEFKTLNASYFSLTGLILTNGLPCYTVILLHSLEDSPCLIPSSLLSLHKIPSKPAAVHPGCSTHLICTLQAVSQQYKKWLIVPLIVAPDGISLGDLLSAKHLHLNINHWLR